jgi:hypothetical protein
LNHFQNTIDVAKHIVVPEAQHSVTGLTQLAITYGVRGRLIVLSSVHFDDQHSLATNKIADVIFDRLLPDEFVSINLPIANQIPEKCFRIGLIDAQPPCDPGGFSIWAAHCPALPRIARAIRPLPAKERGEVRRSARTAQAPLLPRPALAGRGRGEGQPHEQTRSNRFTQRSFAILIVF